MRHRTSIDRSVRWITALIAFVIAIVTSWSAYMSLKEEREYWLKQVGKNLKVQVISIVTNEFRQLTTTVEGFSSSNITYGFAKYGKTKNLERLFSNENLHKEALTSVLLVDKVGQPLFSNSVTSERLDELIHDMFLPIDGVHYKPSNDYGLIFVEGRIFLFLETLLLNTSHDDSIGTIVALREVNTDMLEMQGATMGLDFDIQFTSASRRIVKVSYSQPKEIKTAKVTRSIDHITYEYQVHYAGGAVQPASFVVYAPMHDNLPSQHILPLAILMFIVAAVLSVWIIIRRFVVQPSLDFAHLVTQSDHFSNDDDKLTKELPLELNMVYNEFKQLYDDIDRQSKFSEQILEAMGDVIITVNIDGEIEYVNPAARRWLEFQEGELLGEPLEIHLNNRGTQDTGVATWLYRANIEKQRVETRTKLTVLSRNDECFDCDVICQPVELNHTTKYHSTAVLVIRLNGSELCDTVNCTQACIGE